MSDELKKALKENKLILGLRETMKKLKNGEVKVVLLASNCAKNIKEEIEYLANLNKVKVVQLDIPSDEVGMVCKKQYGVSVLSY